MNAWDAFLLGCLLDRAVVALVLRMHTSGRGW